MMLTRAEKRGDRYVMHGRKWFITGAEDAAHFILMARTSDDPRKGLTAFLFHRDQPGWRIDRRIPIMGPEEHGGHCEIVSTGWNSRMTDVLMGEGEGLKADADPPRPGAAHPLHALARPGQALRRDRHATMPTAQGFGIRLADRESTQIMLGDLAMGSRSAACW
jgi:acyl-CoA dehydrogenase